MAMHRTLNALEIREIGEALYGVSWQGEMARVLGVPRQSIGYYLKAGGAKGAQSAAIVGLVARSAAHEAQTAKDQKDTNDDRQANLLRLLRRFDP